MTTKITGKAVSAEDLADFVLPLRTITSQRSSNDSETAVATAATTKFAFGSCHKSKYADARIWSTVAAEQATAFLWTGDAIYPPVRDIATVEQLQTEYRKMTGPFNETHKEDPIGYYTHMLQNDDGNSNISMFGTWDDHDYGGNDRGNDMPNREERAAAYWEFLNQTKPDASRSGLYYSVVWTNKEAATQHKVLEATVRDDDKSRTVQVLFLDTRWHRQPHCLVPSLAGRFPLGAGIACLTRWLAAGLFPNYCNQYYTRNDAALLGAEQWAWLEEQLLLNATTTSTTQPPNVILIVSSIQVLTTNPAMESWGQFPHERDRLVQLLHDARRRHGSVVTILSGDVHYGEILTPQPELDVVSSQQDNNPHDLASFVEVTSSGLTHDCSKHIYGKMCQPLLDTFARHRRTRTLPQEDHLPREYYIGRNYGTVTIDWGDQAATDAPTSVEIKVHDVLTGTAVLTTGLRHTVAATTENDDHVSPLTTVVPCMDGHLQPYAYKLSIVILVLAALTVSILRIRTSHGRGPRPKRDKVD